MTIAPLPTSDVDLFSDELLTDPYPTYAQLRHTAAAVYLTACDAWAVPRYADVRRALADPNLFTSGRGVALNAQMNEMMSGSVLCLSGAEHRATRGLLSGSLSPRMIRGLEGAVQATADALVDRIVMGRRFDAVADLARPFPVSVLVDMIGFPTERVADLQRWADASFQVVGPANTRCVDGFTVLPEMFHYLAAVTAEDFAPGQLGRRMFDAVAAGEVSRDDVVTMLWNFTGPAMDTTISAIGHAIWRFTRSPEQWARLRADRSLIASATLEVLRLDAAIQLFARELTADADIGGVAVPAGARVLMMYGSANRDERRFVDPDVFDVARNPVDQLAFGYGPHVCVGQGLARTQVHAVLRALAERVATFEIEDVAMLNRPPRHLNNLIRALASLPVTVEPA